MRHGEGTLRHLLSPVQDLLDDPLTKHVVIQREREVGFQKDGPWEWREVEAFDARTLDAIGLYASELMSKRFDPAHPFCLARLADGERITLVRPPASDFHALTIAVPTKHGHDDEIREARFADLMEEAENRLDHDQDDVGRELAAMHKAKAWREFLTLAVTSRKTIGATGEKGSAKTTFLLEQLLPKIDSEERVVTIERTPEFNTWIRRNRVSLFFGSAGVSAEDCFEIFLSMRADRATFQELQAGEAWAFLRLDASGHGGSLTTWHARETDPFAPLVLMAKTSPSGRGIPDDKLEKMFRGFIDIIVHCERHPVTKKYSVTSVYYRGAHDHTSAQLAA